MSLLQVSEMQNQISYLKTRDSKNGVWFQVASALRNIKIL